MKTKSVNISGRIEKADGQDTLVIETRTFYGRLAIAGNPLGELLEGQIIDVQISEHYFTGEKAGVSKKSWHARTVPRQQPKEP